MKKLYVLFLLALTTSTGLSAQGRAYIRNRIASWDSCRSVAITKTNGDLALHGYNGYAESNLPGELSKALATLKEQGKYIDDVTLTESGEWLIVYGDQGFMYSSIPEDLELRLFSYEDDNEAIYSVSFNDRGDWVIVTEDHMAASDSKILAWLNNGEDDYGELWTVFLNDDGIVAVYEKGYLYRGDVPEALKTALNDTSIDCYFVKFAGQSYFFADEDGKYDYSM